MYFKLSYDLICLKQSSNSSYNHNLPHKNMAKLLPWRRVAILSARKLCAWKTFTFVSVPAITFAVGGIPPQGMGGGRMPPTSHHRQKARDNYIVFDLFQTCANLFSLLCGRWIVGKFWYWPKSHVSEKNEYLNILPNK